MSAQSAPPAPPPLPCLFSNNSITTPPEKINKLNGGHKKTALIVAEEIQNLAKDFGLGNLGFLTLTFKDHVTSPKEAQKRFNSLNTNILKARYKRAIGVWERQKSGRIHFHLVIVLDAEIRSGFDFEALKLFNDFEKAGSPKSEWLPWRAKAYKSANSNLRNEWEFWRETAPNYNFGRTEVLPVKSTAEGIARYVGGYIKKHVGNREEQDKGARMVRFIGFKPGDRRINRNFSWNTENAWLWRQKLKTFCKTYGLKDTEEIAHKFGRRWAWFLQETIIGTQLGSETAWPSEELFSREEKRILEAMRDYVKTHGLEISSEIISKFFHGSDPKDDIATPRASRPGKKTPDDCQKVRPSTLQIQTAMENRIAWKMWLEPGRTWQTTLHLPCPG